MAKRKDVNNSSILTILLIVAGIFVISGGLTGNAITGNAWLDWFKIAPPSPTYEITPTPSPEYIVPTEPVYIAPTYVAPTEPTISTNGNSYVEPVPTTGGTTTTLPNGVIQTTYPDGTIVQTYNGIVGGSSDLTYKGTITILTDGTLISEKLFSDGSSVTTTINTDGSTETIVKSADGKFKTTTTTSSGKTTQY